MPFVRAAGFEDCLRRPSFWTFVQPDALQYRKRGRLLQLLDFDGNPLGETEHNLFAHLVAAQVQIVANWEGPILTVAKPERRRAFL
jgi:hypothetical protein